MLNPLTQPLIPLTEAEFALFQKLIYEWAGIHMGDTKQALITGRLMKRLRHYGFNSFSEYLKLVRDENHSDEKQIMINLLTTNETYFFREPKHFAWLKRKIAAHPSGETFRLWSAASSSGQEVYSLAMVLADAFGFSGWQILGSDISEKILEVAMQATYPMEQAAQISPDYLKKFCLKGCARSRGHVLHCARAFEKYQIHEN
jgi:chemotaxis protein methyltransferase CheR